MQKALLFEPCASPLTGGPEDMPAPEMSKAPSLNNGPGDHDLYAEGCNPCEGLVI